ncbi:MAG: OmpA family protein [candidate division WOR-3 bacterium]|nr:OmpA family protein [candidate division WOR-3 bacterium]
MKIRHLMEVVVVTLVTFAAPALAAINSPTLLFETPTADVLPACALAISADGSYPLVQTPQNANYFEANANIRFSPLKHLDFAVTAYTFADYVLDAKYQILGGEPDHFGLAVGVYDVGFNSYVSPIGHGLDAAWPDWKYNAYLPRYNRQTERFSAFVVTSIPVTRFARLHLGLGRGRFVGYDRRSKYFNIDQFFDEYHQWAFGLFGGAEVYVTPKVALIASASGRDMNSGVKANFGAFTATVAWMKMEGLLFSEGDGRFGRLQVGLTYQFNNLCQHQESDIPLYHVAPAPAPAPEPEQPPVAAPSPEKLPLRLNPIWFKWDKWDITAEAAATLRQNADVLLAHPDMRIVITGYASEEGTLEHNLPLSTRRAYAAYEYLQSLGVPAAQMRTRALGESAGRPLPMHRSVNFETVR